MNEAADDSIEVTELVCPNCGELVEGPEFCQNCLCPVGATTNLDPIRTIQGEGFALRAGIRHARNPYVLAAMWMIGVPAVLSPLCILRIEGEWDWTVDGAMLTIYGLGSALFALILYRATRVFVTERETRSAQDK